MKTGIIFIDPGYGGTVNIGGFDANHAASALGDLGKKLTLEIAKLLVIELQLKKHQTFLTRESDINLSLRDRANFAKSTNAEFLYQYILMVGTILLHREQKHMSI